MGHIASIVYKPAQIDFQPPEKFSRIPVERIRLIVGHGLEGDTKGKDPKRQLNIMTRETMNALKKDGFKTEPGQLGEQIIISGIDVDQLNSGDQLQIGDQAIIEIIEPRTGCNRFHRIQGIHPKNAKGRLGMIAKVVASGLIELNSEVTLVKVAEVNV